MRLQCRFTGLGDKTCSLNADEIAKIEQAKKIHRFGADFLRVDINLNPPGRVAQVEKVTFAHVAMCGDAASSAERFAFLKLGAHLCDRSVRLESSAEWLDSTRAKRIEFFAP